MFNLWAQKVLILQVLQYEFATNAINHIANPLIIKANTPKFVR